jgi:hypothetical protein
MADLTEAVGNEALREGLSWLYETIQRGRVEPLDDAAGMRYRFVGGRRTGDVVQDAPGRGRQPHATA